MKRNAANNILIVAGVAVATTLLALALFLPTNLSAVDTPAPAAAIEQPTLTCDGVKLTVKSSAAIYRAGEMAVLELTAVNTTGKPVTLTPALRMTSAARPSELSRAMPMPKQVWQTEQTLSLKPGEVRTVGLNPNVPLTGPSTVSVTVSVGKESIVAARFTVDRPANSSGGPTTQPTK
jgi:hypothetical protein